VISRSQVYYLCGFHLQGNNHHFDKEFSDADKLIILLKISKTAMLLCIIKTIMMPIKNYDCNQNNYDPNQNNYDPNQNNYNPNQNNYNPNQNNYNPNQKLVSEIKMKNGTKPVNALQDLDEPEIDEMYNYILQNQVTCLYSLSKH